MDKKCEWEDDQVKAMRFLRNFYLITALLSCLAGAFEQRVVSLPYGKRAGQVWREGPTDTNGLATNIQRIVIRNIAVDETHQIVAVLGGPQGLSLFDLEGNHLFSVPGNKKSKADRIDKDEIANPVPTDFCLDGSGGVWVMGWKAWTRKDKHGENGPDFDASPDDFDGFPAVLPYRNGILLLYRYNREGRLLLNIGIDGKSMPERGFDGYIPVIMHGSSAVHGNMRCGENGHLLVTIDSVIHEFAPDGQKVKTHPTAWLDKDGYYRRLWSDSSNGFVYLDLIDASGLTRTSATLENGSRTPPFAGNLLDFNGTIWVRFHDLEGNEILHRYDSAGALVETCDEATAIKNSRYRPPKVTYFARNTGSRFEIWRKTRN